MHINDLCKEAYQNAEKHGFWEDYDRIIKLAVDKTLYNNDFKMLMNNAISTRLALIHSEVSEALEALRKDDNENFREELADVVIRIGDLCGGLGIDLESEITKKMEKNKSRERKHGKLF